MMQVVQEVQTAGGNESFIDLASPVQEGSVLIVYSKTNAMLLNAGHIATAWWHTDVNQGSGDIRQVCFGYGPFTTATRLQLTPGRSPAKIDATLQEVRY